VERNISLLIRQIGIFVDCAKAYRNWGPWQLWAIKGGRQKEGPPFQKDCSAVTDRRSLSAGTRLTFFQTPVHESLGTKGRPKIYRTQRSSEPEFRAHSEATRRGIQAASASEATSPRSRTTGLFEYAQDGVVSLQPHHRLLQVRLLHLGAEQVRVVFEQRVHPISDTSRNHRHRNTAHQLVLDEAVAPTVDKVAGNVDACDLRIEPDLPSPDLTASLIGTHRPARTVERQTVLEPVVEILVDLAPRKACGSSAA